MLPPTVIFRNCRYVAGAVFATACLALAPAASAETTAVPSLPVPGGANLGPTPFAPLGGSPSASTQSGVVPAAGDACAVKAFGPASAAGKALGSAENICVPPVTYTGVEACLNRDDNNKWVTVACQYNYKYSAGKESVGVNSPCTGSKYFYVSAIGYGELYGVLYAGYNNSKAGFC